MKDMIQKRSSNLTKISQRVAAEPIIAVRTTLQRMLVTYSEGQMDTHVRSLTKWLISPPTVPIVVRCNDSFTRDRILEIRECSGVRLECELVNESRQTVTHPYVLEIPSLQDRIEDLPLLTAYCLDSHEEAQEPIEVIELEVLALLMALTVIDLQFELNGFVPRLNLDQFIELVYEFCDRVRKMKHILIPKSQVGFEVEHHVLTVPAYRLRLLQEQSDVCSKLSLFTKMNWFKEYFERDYRQQRNGSWPGWFAFGLDPEVWVSTPAMGWIATQNLLHRLGLQNQSRESVAPSDVQSRMRQMLIDGYHRGLMITDNKLVTNPYRVARHCRTELMANLEQARVVQASSIPVPKSVKSVSSKPPMIISRTMGKVQLGNAILNTPGISYKVLVQALALHRPPNGGTGKEFFDRRTLLTLVGEKDKTRNLDNLLQYFYEKNPRVPKLIVKYRGKNAFRLNVDLDRSKFAD